jgi:hypothetical protein
LADWSIGRLVDWSSAYLSVVPVPDSSAALTHLLAIQPQTSHSRRQKNPQREWVSNPQEFPGIGDLCCGLRRRLPRRHGSVPGPAAHFGMLVFQASRLYSKHAFRVKTRPVYSLASETSIDRHPRQRCRTGCRCSSQSLPGRRQGPMPAGRAGERPWPPRHQPRP